MIIKKKDFGSLMMIRELLGKLSNFGDTFRLIMRSEGSIYSPASLLENNIILERLASEGLISEITSKLEEGTKISKETNRADNKLEKIGQEIEGKLMKVLDISAEWLKESVFTDERSPLVQKARVISRDENKPYNEVLNEFRSKFSAELTSRRRGLDSWGLESVINLGIHAYSKTFFLDPEPAAGKIDPIAEKAESIKKTEIYLELVKFKRQIFDELVEQGKRVDLGYLPKRGYNIFISDFNPIPNILSNQRAEPTVRLEQLTALKIMLTNSRLKSILPTQEEVNQAECISKGSKILESLQLPQTLKEDVFPPLSERMKGGSQTQSSMSIKEVPKLKSLCAKLVGTRIESNHKEFVLDPAEREIRQNSRKKLT